MPADLVRAEERPRGLPTLLQVVVVGRAALTPDVLVLRTGPGTTRAASGARRAEPTVPADRGTERGEPDGSQTLYVSVAGNRAAHPDAGRAGSMTAIGSILVFTSTEQHGSGSEHEITYTYVLDCSSLDLPTAGVRTEPDRYVDARDPLAALVSTYLTQLAGNALNLSAEQRAELEQPTVELLRSLLTTVAAAPSTPRAPGESLGARIMDYIRLNLTDRDLSVATVARHHNISQRYVYLILSKFGVTFSDWVRLQRLQGAAADLGDADRRDETISSIAHRWGFPDHANFSRAFRREFAVTPREFRIRALPMPLSVGGARTPRTTLRAMPGPLRI